MKIEVPRGKYVVAVSGGVDSMVLLHLLMQQDQFTVDSLQLTVAHFNHGMRADADQDEEFVSQTAQKYHLPFEVGHGRLGPGASEATARKVRYQFLNGVKQKHRADAIITAHHQDDVIETAILNIMRGTGRRGLTAIFENPNILRPLLNYSKKSIITYARQKKLQWREDPTNKDTKYLRNYIRAEIVPKLSANQRQHLLRGLDQMAVTNRLINQEIATLSQKIVNGDRIIRSAFITLPTEVGNELLMHFLRSKGLRDFDKRTIERLSVAIKTAKKGTKHDVQHGAYMEVMPSEVHLVAVAKS